MQRYEMKDVLKTIIVDFIEKKLPEIKKRELELPVDSGKIISVVGARRTGKTSLLYGLISKLRRKLPADRLVYINFEDDRLFPATLQTMDLFLQSYYELFPHNKDESVYFFFDEVQEIENWERFVRRVYDTEKCHIFLTGSSSKLLIREISTALRGRSISYEVFPLSFKEYVSFKNLEINAFSSRSHALLINTFDEYLSGTAFPELVNMEQNLKQKALKEYVDLVIYKDIVEKYRVSNIHLMKYLIKFLFSNSANLISVNKIYNALKSSGLQVSRNSVYEYISYLEDSYTLFGLSLYTRNLREQQRNPRKYYALDTGLRQVMTIAEDSGKLLESTVYLHLRRNYDNVFYFADDQEVDFIVQENKTCQLFNVCYDLTAINTRDREINALRSAMNTLNVKTSHLLTGYEEGEEKFDDLSIRIIPVWKWLLWP